VRAVCRRGVRKCTSRGRASALLSAADPAGPEASGHRLAHTSGTPTEPRTEGQQVNAPPPVQRLGSAVLIQGPAVLELMRLAVLGAKLRSTRDGIAMPDSTRRLIQALADAAGDVAAGGQRDMAEDPDPASWQVVDGVTTKEVAGMLQLSQRQARRLAPALGGRKVGGVLLVDRDAALAFAAERGATGE
jgi:hypothetical protein